VVKRLRHPRPFSGDGTVEGRGGSIRGSTSGPITVADKTEVKPDEPRPVNKKGFGCGWVTGAHADLRCDRSVQKHDICDRPTEGVKHVLVATVIVVAVVAFLVWKWGPRRPQEPGFKFVHVNQDGSVRELSPEEQDYLSAEFHGSDGGRPYIKLSYESRDGWGSQSGFIERRGVPARIEILPVHPDYDAAVKKLREDPLGRNQDAGDVIIQNPDGSVTYILNPDLSRKQRYELIRERHLEQERRREALAKVESARPGG
jgi:hypothetical protein